MSTRNKIFSFGLVLIIWLSTAASVLAVPGNIVSEPLYTSPTVLTNQKGQVVFYEHFDGTLITGVEFIDPGSGEILYAVDLDRGVIVGALRGTAIEGSLSKEVGTVVEHRYRSNDQNTMFLTKTKNGELIGYRLTERKFGSNSSVKHQVELSGGQIISLGSHIVEGGRLVKIVSRLPGENTYKELSVDSDGETTLLVYEDRLLESEDRQHQQEPFPHYRGFYHKGRLGYYMKNILGQDGEIDKVAIFDADDNLIDEARPVLGENFVVTRGKVDGQPALKYVKRQGNEIAYEAFMKF